MTEERPIRAVLIAGPTASGKSGLALAIAERLGGAVVNADASQVYADLRVLSARPGAEEEARAPHLLYGHVDAGEAYGAGRWLADIHRVIDRLSTGCEALRPQAAQGPDAAPTSRLPIVVGGTGLYFEALTGGLAVVPEIPSAVRARWRAWPAAELHAALAARDPLMASRLRPSDPQRLMRALEVIDATGRSLSQWQADMSKPLVDPLDTLRIVLAPDRAALDERIAWRIDVMMHSGAIEEAAHLWARGLDPALPAMKALGVQAFAAASRGELSNQQAFERTRLDTRRYAKRQSTWTRNRMADWLHVAPEEALELATSEIGRRGVEGGGLA